METSVHPLDQPLPPALREFVARAAPSLFLDPEWLNLYTHAALEPDERAALLCIGPVDEPRAVLALCLGKRRRGWFSASETRSLSNYYVLDWQVLRVGDPRQGIEAAVGRAIVQGLRQLGNPLLRFGPLEPEHANELQGLLKTGGYRCGGYEAFVNWVEPVLGRNFDTYFAARPSQLRSTANRRRRRLEQSFSIRTRICTGVEELEEMLADYEHVYARSWKPAEAHPEFMAGLIRLAASRRALRLGVLYANDAPIAAHLWLVENARARIYKLAYDQQYRAYSPGLALAVEMFRHALDVDRVALLDYGSGDEAYKRDWMTERRVRHGIEAIDLRRPTGLLIDGLMRLRTALRGGGPIASLRAFRRGRASAGILESRVC